MKEYKNNKKYMVKRLDNKSNIKRKYQLIIEETYQYESDSPDDIEKILNGYELEFEAEECENAIINLYKKICSCKTRTDFINLSDGTISCR